jgi:FkbM family methyltransferase
MYSQNNEEQIALDYFKNADHSKMWLLDVGANDGITFSNSKALIDIGWNAVLLEPSPKAYSKLCETHYGKNENVALLNYGINIFDGEHDFYESGGYENGSDVALYSSVEKIETQRWGDKVQFEKIKADFVKWKTFLETISTVREPIFNFISIDIEGLDWLLLNQMDLKALGCEMVVIEFNGNRDMAMNMISHCSNYGLKEISRNPENLIFAK